MKQNIALVSILVADYDEAIRFYTSKLNFTLKEDTVLSDAKRWVVVTPPGSDSTGLLLAKAASEEQRRYVGNQAGGRVFLFLHTDDFDSAYRRLVDQNVRIVRTPVVERWGKVAVFADLYGNLWDLVQPAPGSKDKKDW
jgi:catechol 2,3-dioxygenase-like lactoylglutathione lyase family enzyme